MVLYKHIILDFLPLVVPVHTFLSNLRSVLLNSWYDMEKAILDLLNSGSVEEIAYPPDLWICNPLGVVPNKGN